MFGLFCKKPAPAETPAPDTLMPKETEMAAPVAKIITPVKLYPTLRRGSKGAGVVSLQTKLKDLALFSDSVDGVFGSKTEAAVKDFQQQFDLVPDGIVGPKTMKAMDIAVKDDGVKQVPVEPVEGVSKPFNLIVVDEAQQYVFVREKGGPNKGPEVEKFQRAVDGVASGEPWCMCFIQYVLKKIEKKYNLSFQIYSSEHCMTVWNKTSKLLRLEKPEAGCLAIFQHYTYNKEARKWEPTSSGHVALVKRVSGDSIYTIEGNTNDSGSREGDGVYEKLRAAWKKDGSLRTVGYLKLEAVYNEVVVNFT